MLGEMGALGRGSVDRPYSQSRPEVEVVLGVSNPDSLGLHQTGGERSLGPVISSALPLEKIK